MFIRNIDLELYSNSSQNDKMCNNYDHPSSIEALQVIVPFSHTDIVIQVV